jgi:hypothetical protein
MFMTFLAYVAIIAFIGLIVGLLSTVSAVRQIIDTGKGSAKLIDKPKGSALRLVETGRRVAFKSRDHAVVIGGHVKSSAQSIGRVKSDLETVMRSTEWRAIKTIVGLFIKS